MIGYKSLRPVVRLFSNNNVPQTQIAVNDQKSVGRGFDELAEESAYNEVLLDASKVNPEANERILRNTKKKHIEFQGGTKVPTSPCVTIMLLQILYPRIPKIATKGAKRAKEFKNI